MNRYKVGLIDDHNLFVESLSGLINSFSEYKVSLICSGGERLFNELMIAEELPDIILLDVNMSGMDGFECAEKITESYPSIKLLALSTHHSDSIIMKMLRNGCRGFLNKDIRPSELLRALDSVIQTGYYASKSVSGRTLSMAVAPEPFRLTSREIEFLKLCSTELTYKEIAANMGVSPRTVDGYRDQLFLKLEVASRVGLVLYAIKNGYVQVLT